MTQNLPPELLKFFTPRPPLPFLETVDPPFEERSKPRYNGLGAYLELIKDHDKDFVPRETIQQKKARKVITKLFKC